jgi:hypothetical protein
MRLKQNLDQDITSYKKLGSVPRIVVNVLVIFVVSQVIAILIVELMLGVLGKST